MVKKIDCKLKSKTRILISSCIRQDSKILETFLKYLFKMDTSKLDVEYLFIDDNDEKESKYILNNIKRSDVKIIENNDYMVEDKYEDHKWTNDLIRKIGYLKNKILDYAIEGDFDYVFYTDSDVISHEYLIKHLLSCKKDIIASILWTEFENFDIESPNVWLYESYGLEDNLDRYNESFKNFESFIKTLKTPNTYKVGYMNSCFLLSKNVLNRGINFDYVDNIYLIRENEHFCIKAAANNIDIFVNTNYPSFHIYSYEDLKNIYNAEKYGYTENEYLKNILSQYMYIRYNTDIQDFEKIYDKLLNTSEGLPFNAKNRKEDVNIDNKSNFAEYSMDCDNIFSFLNGDNVVKNNEDVVVEKNDKLLFNKVANNKNKGKKNTMYDKFISK